MRNETKHPWQRYAKRMKVTLVRIGVHKRNGSERRTATNVN